MQTRISHPINSRETGAGSLITRAASVLAVAAISLTFGLPAHAQVASTGNLTGQTQPQGPLPVWRNIIEAPADFPAPIFRGSSTKFMSLNQVPQVRIPGGSSQLMLRADESPEVVANWYRAALPSYGLQLDSAHTSPPVAGLHFIRGASSSLSCTVSIVRKQDQSGPATIVLIAAVRK